MIDPCILDKRSSRRYILKRKKKKLQGRVKLPTGGKVRERKLNRCNSGTDSIVWMEEVWLLFYGRNSNPGA